MKKYDEYKDSGVAWIGEVPKHWKVIKTSLAFQGIGSGTTPSTSKKEYYDDNGNGKYWLQTGDLEDGIVYDTSKKVSNIAIKECNLTFYPIDSIIIAMYGATIGKIGILGIESATNQACCVIPVTQKQIAKYFFYEFLACKPALLIAAIGGGQPNISQDTIKKLKIVIPPIIEQAAIATYLDTYCAKIDNLISIQQKRIALLQELKQSVITHAVTKGLNPNVEMKPSGVEWIGDVPKHWKILRGKYVLNILSGFPFDSQKFEFEDNGVYMPLIRIRDINCRSTEVYYSGSYPIESVVKTGEVLIGMDGDFNISKWKGTNALLNQRVCKLREDSSMNTHYAFYMLSSPLKAINSVTYATTVKHLSVYDIYNVFIPVPPIPEQAAIASYLDHKCATIDASISNAQHQIELLQEYKQSLITEVVTGKRKVTEN